MKIEGPVLAATAVDDAGDEVIRQAAAHAEHAHVPLVVCHVLPEIYGIRPLFPHLRESDRPYAEAARRGVMEAADQQLRRVLGRETPVRELRIEAGSPHSMVLRVADEIGAGMVVVGTGSHERGASLGGVAERIVRHARSPVLIARPPAGVAVLAATDFSDPGLPAVEAGRNEARRRRQRFVVLHAVDIKVIPVEASTASPAYLVRYLVEAETELAKARMRDIAKSSDIPTESLVVAGTPADAVLAAAASLPADLVVVGTHGRSGIGRLTLGSVAETVVRKAACSVLVVRLA